MNVGEKLARFAPQVQLRDVLAGFDDGTKQMPSQESGHAALLFIDLSGFTALTERSAARGRRGAENLTEIINKY
ncbi:MAG: hypothetical protein OEM60_07180, partial [Gammaproteobacteria bacterium]|nr:hypothetical protein [Gammaproteobacteria bacterium]